MEKYRQFADKRTSVNPFVPPWSVRPLSSRLYSVVAGIKFLVFSPLALLRILFFAVTVLWLMLSGLFCAFIPLGFIRYPVYRLLTYLGSFAALLSLGVLPVGNSCADHRRLKIPAPKASSRTFDAQHGTLVFMNYQGLTDILFAVMALSPTFIMVSNGGEPVQVSLIKAILRAAAPTPVQKHGRHQSLTEIAIHARKNWGGPVVVFAEGARTNGTCALAWRDRTFQQVPDFATPAGTALLALEYSQTGAYTPHHTVGSMFAHLFWLCSQPWHTVRSTWLCSNDVAAAFRGKPLEEQKTLLRTLQVRMIPAAVEVDIFSDKYQEFIAYWNASRHKGYTKQIKKKA